nr:hypothetical protein [Tanacetum cinerariifolium]
MDLFSLIRAPNPAKVKTGSRPSAPHEHPLLTLTAAQVIDMDEPAVATDSSGVSSAIEKSPLDFADEAASGRETAAPEMPPPEGVAIATLRLRFKQEAKLLKKFVAQELYPHMLTAIAGRRWVIGHGLRLAMMKFAESVEMRQAFADVVSAGIAKGMSEGLKHGVEHGRSQLGLESIEAYDPEAEDKFVATLQSLKDLKFSLLDQLEGLKDAPMDVIMAALYLESDTGGDAPQSYAISASVPHNYLSPCIRSRAEKKKKCRIVCRTHGVSSAHHARSDGIPMSVPAVRSSQGVTVAEDPGSENASSPIEVLSPGSVYHPEWGVTYGSLLETPEACQDLMDHVAPPGYFAELRHMPNDEFLRQYNVAVGP